MHIIECLYRQLTFQVPVSGLVTRIFSLEFSVSTVVLPFP